MLKCIISHSDLYSIIRHTHAANTLPTPIGYSLQVFNLIHMSYVYKFNELRKVYDRPSHGIHLKYVFKSFILPEYKH